MPGIRSVAKALSPPILVAAARWTRQQLSPRQAEWEYVPEGWAATNTDPKLTGWNVQSVLDAYRVSWPAFVKSIQGPEPYGDSLRSHATLLAYSYALLSAAQGRTALRLLDWGGGIGHYYLLSHTILPGVALDYTCKDVPLLAEYGQGLFPEARFTSADSCLDEAYDFVFASGSLQYAEDWQAMLARLARAATHSLYIARLPITDEPSFVCVQRPYQYGYGTEYLGWCLNRGEFLAAAAAAGVTLAREFLTGELFPVHHAGHAPIRCEGRSFLFSTNARQDQ